MLILYRKKNESIVVGENCEIEVHVVEICGDRVRLGVKCPSETRVQRQEVYEAKKRTQQEGD